MSYLKTSSASNQFKRRICLFVLFVHTKRVAGWPESRSTQQLHGEPEAVIGTKIVPTPNPMAEEGSIIERHTFLSTFLSTSSKSHIMYAD